MNYVGLHIVCSKEATEILIAELSLLPFDTFEEKESGFSAFCEEELFNENGVDQVLARYQPVFPVSSSIEIIPKKNWNEEWEKNFDPVVVAGKVLIRAPFHERKDLDYDIMVTPKMSFGTGHHPTTHLMIKAQLGIDHQDKVVFDIGTGTGILAIMAEKLGARDIVVTDIDDWSIDNSKENLVMNGVKAEILKGNITEQEFDKKADIILANINKNVLLSEMDQYKGLLSDQGVILLSGFYVKDIPDLLQKCDELGLRLERQDMLEDWAVLVLHSEAL